MSSNNNEGLMADPYASPGSASAPPRPPMLSSSSSPDEFQAAPAASDDLFLNIPSQPVPQPDFLFDESYDESFRRGFGERLTYHVGVAYSLGASCTLRTAPRRAPALTVLCVPAQALASVPRMAWCGVWRTPVVSGNVSV